MRYRIKIKKSVVFPGHWVVYVDDGEFEWSIGVFPSKEAAEEAAKPLEQTT